MTPERRAEIRGACTSDGVLRSADRFMRAGITDAMAQAAGIDWWLDAVGDLIEAVDALEGEKETDRAALADIRAALARVRGELRQAHIWTAYGLVGGNTHGCKRCGSNWWNDDEQHNRVDGSRCPVAPVCDAAPTPEEST